MHWFSIVLIPLLLVGCTDLSEGKKLQPIGEPVHLFNGQSFAGWEGDTSNTWKIVDGAIQGGSLTATVPHNEFLCTNRAYDNFILKLQFKLEGTEGFINAGVQFRSKRHTNPDYEMIGYQADIGAGYWGALYDESRRDKVLAGPDQNEMSTLIKPGDWNDYEIRAEGQRIRLFLNGRQTVDYLEVEKDIADAGLIGLQVHGGGKVLVSYREIIVQEL